MERMERTAWTGAAVRSAAARARTLSDLPDVPAWDVIDVPASTIDALRNEVSALRERLAQAAPKRVVVEMDRAITVLNRKVEDIRDAGAADRDGRERALAGELAELRAALAALRNPERLRALRSGLDALSRKIDLLGARAVDPVEVARLQGQLLELKDLVGRAVTGAQAHGGLAKIAERLAACADDVTRAGEETARRVADATVVFERSAVALLSRVEQMEARARAGDPAAAEDLRHTLLTALEGVHRRLDEVSSQVGQQLATLSPAMGAELTQRLDTLLTRITAAEEAGKVAAGPLADVVERHLVTLTEQFRDTHARLGRLEDIETSLKTMAEEMRQARDSAHSATAEAVRAVTAKVSEDTGGPAVVGLKRGLAALEARQDEIERRTCELLADQLEFELRDISVSLGREDDDTWAPRGAAGAQSSYTEAEYAEEMGFEPAAHGAEHPRAEPPHAEALRPEPARAEAPCAEPPRAEPFAAASAGAAGPDDAAALAEAEAFLSAEVPWPRARRVDRGQSERDEGDDARPRLGERRGSKKREPKAERKPHRGGFSGRRRHVAMVALIAGATTIFAGTAAGLAWRNGPELLSGVTSAVRRLAIPATQGSAAADLPAPIGTQPLQVAARGGNPAAAYLVARLYAEGGDIDSAIKWLGFAVSQGYAPAAHRLGAVYETEKGDLGEARRFYEWAAEQGNLRAMHALAMLMSEGTLPGASGKPDWDGAIRWFRTAAELGHRDSQYNLGVVYARGLGISADLVAAWKWLSLAAAQGDEDSARKRDIIAKEMDTAALVRAQQEVTAFVPGTPSAAANATTMRPEWEAGPLADGVASAPASAPGMPMQVASAPVTARGAPTQVASRSAGAVK